MFTGSSLAVTLLALWTKWVHRWQLFCFFRLISLDTFETVPCTPMPMGYLIVAPSSPRLMMAIPAADLRATEGQGPTALLPLLLILLLLLLLLLLSLQFSKLSLLVLLLYSMRAQWEFSKIRVPAWHARGQRTCWADL